MGNLIYDIILISLNAYLSASYQSYSNLPRGKFSYLREVIPFAI